MQPNPEPDAQVETLLRSLKHTPLRAAPHASRARAAFLQQVRQLTPRVSNPAADRLNGWQERFGTFGFTARKEKRSMFSFVMTLLLALGVVFGGAGTAVAVAQGAQPEDALYAVKTWSEDVRLRLAPQSQTKLELALQFSARRVEEIQNGLMLGTAPSTQLLTRFENQLRQQLQIAAGMPDELLFPALLQVREQAQLQEQEMAQLQLQDAAGLQLRERLRSMLQAQAQEAAAGLQDPQRLREQLRLMFQDMPAPPTHSTDAAQSTQPALNPWTTSVPTPGSGYGPGPSQNPWMDATPVPGPGYGPGPGGGDCPNCLATPRGGSSGQSGSSGGSSQSP
ncbi:MAG TPA: DUF5667 domain-containing protein [Anaerolineales bacterium]|nr:DUF5667 domain-containing protein [Anaerolineales bacterium]